jgi:predicted CxxxxCH...CXXCH cytochrome family protein
MISKTHSFRDPRNPIGVLILLAAFAAAAGCSTANTTGGDVVVNHVNASGNSVPGWVTPTGGSHANSATMNYIANGGSSSCTECHGSDLAGGISRVSCFGNTAGCHHGPIPNWITAAVHGATAKKAPGSSGFASCQICHGSNFSGGGATVSCYTCHGVSAPHAPKPWRGLSGSPYTHTTTDPANAPVCAQCHYPGSSNNPANHPATPAAAGTAPGCFNGTMCHNQAGHPAGWAATAPAAQPHGDAAKKDNTVSGQGFPYCKTCHGTGTNFSGGTSGVSCYTCHGVSAPHAPKPWRGSPYTHTDTAEAGNAPVCYQCHAYTGTANPNNPHVPPTPAPTGTAPGCFNGTMCHNQAGHPAGWAATPPAAQPHGDAAKKDNTVSGQGFPYCKTCHGTGTNFAGGTSGVSCYTCHGVSAPHAPKPWRGLSGSPYTHTDTAEAGNASVCVLCHFPGSPNNPANHPATPAPAGTSPGCFNSTLCHGSAGAAHPVPYNDNSHYTVITATFTANCSPCHDVSAPSTKVGPVCQTCHVAASPLVAANCTSCHASPPNGGAPAGAVYANIAGAHAVHIALNSVGGPVSCETCHTGLGPSLLNLNHYNRAKSRVPPGDAAFPATYNAKTGASSFDNSASLNCSNVSCHGGQATPNWQTGTLDVNTQCTSCHALGTAQYNSYNSGEHNQSNHLLFSCTVCHNTTTLAVNHFTTLADNTISPAVAAAAVGGTGTLITTWTPGTGTSGTCNAACHPGNRNW